MNEGHDAYATDPAIVSGQHNQPSHVPWQCLPEIFVDKKENE